MGHLGWAHNTRFNFGLRLGILEGDFGAFRKPLRKNQHPATGADSVRCALDRLLLAFHLNQDANPEQNTLRSAAFLGRGRTRGNHSMSAVRLGVGLRFYHSSSPQKSISGATSSTPYSQPSGRGMPRQTTMAALLVSVARLVSARRCSS